MKEVGWNPDRTVMNENSIYIMAQGCQMVFCYPKCKNKCTGGNDNALVDIIC
jgi:hypothetical protein